MPSSTNCCGFDHAARSELAQLDEEEPEVIARHRDEEVRKANRESNTDR
jgi:hypothetical protein